MHPALISLSFYVMDKGASPIAIKRQIIEIVLNDLKYPTINSIADDVVAECMKKCDTEFDRTLWLHDWLLDNCTYDYSHLHCGSEGAFTRGIGTYETYHRAYTMLLNCEELLMYALRTMVMYEQQLRLTEDGVRLIRHGMIADA